MESEQKKIEQGVELEMGSLAGMTDGRTKPTFDKLTQVKIKDVKLFGKNEPKVDSKGMTYYENYIRVVLDWNNKEIFENYSFRIYKEGDGPLRPWLGNESAMNQVIKVVRKAFGKGKDLQEDFQNMIGKDCFVITENRKGSMKIMIDSFKLG